MLAFRQPTIVCIDMIEEFYTQHADDQMLERYHVTPSHIDWVNAFMDILERRSLLLAKQQNGRERHLVKVGKTATIVIYCPEVALIITALPPHGRYSGPNCLI